MPPIADTLTPDTLTIVPLADIPSNAVERLLDAAFGADRRSRTAYRIRDGVAAAPGLSFATVDGAGRLIASCQTWPIELAGDDGRAVPLLLLGPIAVDPARQQGGIGRALTAHALAAIDAAGEPATALIGDPEYYGRFFGFTADASGGWRTPGPVERRRLMARIAPGTALPVDGLLRPRGA